ncbi:MAG: hypothetical protein HWE30_14655 [Methylocystaceae bacterium]|nr:hypothetical protein [Methylocystaceae bacterium]
MIYIKSFLLLLTLAATVLFKTQHMDVMLYVASCAVLIYLALSWFKVSLPGKIFISLSGVLLLAFWGRGVDFTVVEQGFSRVALFSAFMVGLVFLRVAAKLSDVIARCGRFLINQKPSARYAVLTYGSCLLGAVLSFGSLNLMGQVIVNGNTLEAAKGDSRIHLVRKKRMVLALLRGFSTLPLSSPFSISMALVLSIVPSLKWQSLVPLSISIAVALIALGWFMDYRTYAKAQAANAQTSYESQHGGAVLIFVAIVLTLFGMSATLSMTFNYGLPVSIIILSPFFAVGWFLLEEMFNKGVSETGILMFAKSMATELNAMSSEVAVIGGASFVGALFSAIIPIELVQDFSQFLGLHGFPLAVFCMLAVMLTSIVGVSPFVSVTILATTFSDVTLFGLSPYVLATSLLVGWALTLNVSPLTISSIIIGRIIECRPSDITLRWNGLYCLIALGFMVATLYGFHLAYD